MDPMTQEFKPQRHVPVLPDEVVQGLEPLDGCVVADLTLGGGGMRNFWRSVWDHPAGLLELIAMRSNWSAPAPD